MEKSLEVQNVLYSMNTIHTHTHTTDKINAGEHEVHEH